MGQHYRRGHYRRGKNGSYHWVSGHSVTGSSRSTFRISGSQPWFAPSQSTYPEVTSVAYTPTTFTRRLVRPNATCPACGASLYFYSNAAGSRVYFDELGPPWPKHPCMDSGERRNQVAPAWAPPRGSAAAPPIPRSRGPAPSRNSTDVPLPSFRERFGIEPFAIWTVAQSWFGSEETLLDLRSIDGQDRKTILLRVSLRMPVGHLVFTSHGTLCFLSAFTLQEVLVDYTNVLLPWLAWRRRAIARR